jgi:hypothetical protein
MSYWQTAYAADPNFRKKEEEERKEKEINRKLEKENKERHKKELEKELEDKRFVLVEKDHDKFDIPPRPVKKWCYICKSDDHHSNENDKHRGGYKHRGDDLSTVIQQWHSRRFRAERQSSVIRGGCMFIIFVAVMLIAFANVTPFFIVIIR